MVNVEDRGGRYRLRAAVFKALGHPARMRVVAELAQGERCVCELVQAVGTGFSTVSRHLAVLRQVGVVADEKRGQQVFYRLAMPCVLEFCACLDAAAEGRARCGCGTGKGSESR